jgi:hypothetical protein
MREIKFRAWNKELILIVLFALAFCQTRAQWFVPQKEWDKKESQCEICGASLEWYEEHKPPNDRMFYDNMGANFDHAYPPSVLDSLNPIVVEWKWSSGRLCPHCAKTYGEYLKGAFDSLRESKFAQWRKENESNRRQWDTYRQRQALDERKTKIKKLQEEIEILKRIKKPKSEERTQWFNLDSLGLRGVFFWDTTSSAAPKSNLYIRLPESCKFIVGKDTIETKRLMEPKK